jgi:hypothetical protein
MRMRREWFFFLVEGREWKGRREETRNERRCLMSMEENLTDGLLKFREIYGGRGGEFVNQVGLEFSLRWVR